MVQSTCFHVPWLGQIHQRTEQIHHLRGSQIPVLCHEIPSEIFWDHYFSCRTDIQ